MLEEKKELILNSDYIYYLCSGIIWLEQTFPSKGNHYALIPANRFLQFPLDHQTSTILTLEKTKLIFFNKKSLFDILEKEDSLVHFIWYLIEDVHQTLQINLFPSHWTTRKRLVYMLKEISGLYSKKPSASATSFLPSWLQVKHLSLLCHCSSQAIHYNLKKLENEKVLTFHAPTKKIDLNKLTSIINHQAKSFHEG